MIETMRDALGRFSEGFSLTRSELHRVKEAERINCDNDLAILGGYSVASRVYKSAEIPGLLSRIRRGLENVLLSNHDPRG